MSKLLYESDFALLTILKGKKILILEWKKNAPLANYIEVFNNALEIVEKNKIEYFISDIRKEGAIKIENLFWLKKNFIPKAENLGILKIALILNFEIYSRIYADSIRKRLEKSRMIISFFEVYDEALAWIDSK